MDADGIWWNSQIKTLKRSQECNTSVPQVYTGRIPPAGSKSANQSNQLIPLHLPLGRGGDLQPSEQQLCCNGSGGKGRSLKFKGNRFWGSGVKEDHTTGVSLQFEMMKFHLELWGDATWFPWHWSIDSLGCVSCSLPGESSRGRKRRYCKRWSGWIALNCSQVRRRSA